MSQENPQNPSPAKLEEHLAALKKTRASTKREHVAPRSDAAKAAIDFASASAVGIVLGYAIDMWLDSTPWGLLGGLFLGFAAGVKMALHSLNKRTASGER